MVRSSMLDLYWKRLAWLRLEREDVSCHFNNLTHSRTDNSTQNLYRKQFLCGEEDISDGRKKKKQPNVGLIEIRRGAER